MSGKLFCALLTVIVIAGCSSDIYYHNRAADRARKFLLAGNNKLNKDDRLSVEEMNFIRYNAPVLLFNDLLGDKSRKKRIEALESDFDQICVTWLIPGRDKAYMVYGVSGARMDHWSPERVIVKKLVKTEIADMLGAVGAAREYAARNYFEEMTPEDMNIIRYTLPTLRRTAFEVNFDPDGKIEEEDYLKAKEEAAVKIQYTLQWRVGARNFVFTGYSEPKLVNWSICFSGVVSDDELQQVTHAVVAEPADFLKPFPEKELQITREILAEAAKTKDGDAVVNDNIPDPAVREGGY